MYRNPLDGFIIKEKFLGKCVREVKKLGKYIPTVLLLSEEDFNGLIMAIAAHGYKQYIFDMCRKYGIKKVVWAEDLPNGEMMLSSEKGIPKNVETLTIPES